MDYMYGGQPDLFVERIFLIHPFILRMQGNMSYPQVTAALDKVFTIHGTLKKMHARSILKSR